MQKIEFGANLVYLFVAEFDFSLYEPSAVAGASMVVASTFVLRISRRQKADMMRWIQISINADEVSTSSEVKFMAIPLQAQQELARM